MKAEVEKLDINRLVNVLTGLNDLKTKVDELDVGELGALPVDLKRLKDVVDKKKLLKIQNSTH